MGVPFRAYQTVPEGLSIEQSSISGAGLGVIATTFILKHTWLGMYEGDLVPHNATDGRYAWSIPVRGKLLDGADVRTSNWMRFVNAARNPSEFNVGIRPCHDKLYYMTRKDIAPGTELLTYYGEVYYARLGIDILQFLEIGKPALYSTRKRGLLRKAQRTGSISDIMYAVYDLLYSR